MHAIVIFILRGIMYFLTALSYAIIVRALLSWFIRQPNSLMNFLDRLTEPLVRPFRPLAMKLAMRMRGGIMLDFAPLLAYLAIQIVMLLLREAEYWLYYAMRF